MDGDKLNDRKIGSVKAAISSYGERILEDSSTTKKLQSRSYSEKSYTRTRELHRAKWDTTHFNESRQLAESETIEAESKLSAAKKTVKDLTLRIEDSNCRAKAQMHTLHKVRVAKRRDEESNSTHSETAKVLKELETIKRDLSKLKLAMSSVSEEKKRAEKNAESSLSKIGSLRSSILELTEKVEEVNEEHVFVELARIEAVKEYREIEVQRSETAEKYFNAIEETRQKIREIEDANELENKLASTVSDVNMLRGELQQIKEVHVPKEEKSVTQELEYTKRELSLINEESFQLMTSMDMVRNEIHVVMEETDRVKKKTQKSESIIQNLSTKLLKAKSKLELASSAEDRAKLIVSNMSVSLEKLQSEVKTIEKERVLLDEETALIKAGIQKTETEIDLAEERLHGMVKELKVVKSLEEVALQNLKEIVESTIRKRNLASKSSSTITISKFEYEYLRGHAAGADEVADKKIVAARAWIEALKASEREVRIKAELARRESQEMDRKDDLSVDSVEEYDDDSESGKERLEPEIGLPRRSMNRSVKYALARKSRARLSTSSLIRGSPRGTSSTIRRKRKGMRGLAQFFNGKGDDRNF